MKDRCTKGNKEHKALSINALHHQATELNGRQQENKRDSRTTDNNDTACKTLIMTILNINSTWYRETEISSPNYYRKWKVAEGSRSAQEMSHIINKCSC